VDAYPVGSHARGNVEHVEQNDLTTHEVDHVLQNFVSSATSHSSGRPCVFGYTPDDRYIVVIYEEIDPDTITPVTAYEVPEP
jgi:hypothetical protein